MKYFILCLLFLMASCSTRLYSVQKNQTDFGVIETGKTYWVYDKNMKKTKMVITSIDGDNISGTVGKTPVSFAKNDIQVVKKPKPGGTAAIIAGSAVGLAAMVITVVSIINNSSVDYNYYGY